MLNKQLTNYEFKNPLENTQKHRQQNFLNKCEEKKMKQETNKKPKMKVRSGLMTATIWENNIEKDNKKMVVTSTTIFQTKQN